MLTKARLLDLICPRSNLPFNPPSKAHPVPAATGRPGLCYGSDRSQRWAGGRAGPSPVHKPPAPTTGRRTTHWGPLQASRWSRRKLGGLLETVVCSSRTATELCRSPDCNSELSPNLTPRSRQSRAPAAPTPGRMSPFLCQDQVGMQPGMVSILPKGGHFKELGYEQTPRKVTDRSPTDAVSAVHSALV